MKWLHVDEHLIVKNYRGAEVKLWWDSRVLGFWCVPSPRLPPALIFIISSFGREENFKIVGKVVVKLHLETH